MEISLPAFAAGTDVARFRAKTRAFLRQQLDSLAVAKLRLNRPLTTADLAELERVLAESGAGGPEDLRRAEQEFGGLGLFVRSLVGLDRAAKDALGSFLKGLTLSANQIEFVNLVVDHLAEHGLLEPARLYESPFTGYAPRGPEGLFTSAQIDEPMRSLDAVRATALAGAASV